MGWERDSDSGVTLRGDALLQEAGVEVILEKEWEAERVPNAEVIVCKDEWSRENTLREGQKMGTNRVRDTHPRQQGRGTLPRRGCNRLCVQSFANSACSANNCPAW